MDVSDILITSLHMNQSNTWKINVTIFVNHFKWNEIIPKIKIFLGTDNIISMQWEWGSKDDNTWYRNRVRRFQGMITYNIVRERRESKTKDALVILYMHVIFYSDFNIILYL